MDQGIIKALKVKFWKKLVLKIINQEEQGKYIKISVLDAILMVSDAWNDVSTTTIRNCFHQAGFKASLNDETEIVSENNLDTECFSEENIQSFAEVDDALLTNEEPTEEEIVKSILNANNDESNEQADEAGTGFAKRKLKLQKEEQTKKLAGSLARFVKPNSLVLSDTLPAVHTDAYIDYINTSSDDFDSSDESEKCEIESNSTTNEVISAPNPTYNSIDKVISGPGDLSQTLENGPKQPKLVCYPKTKEKSIFVNEGYNNWKNALGSNSGLKKHHMSNDHKTSHAMWTSYLDMKKAGNVSVASLINDGHLKLVKENRNFIKSIGRVLLYTAVQGIAQRGDNEGESSLNRGNFVEL
ncbi:hypothetical protein QTP88_013939 [Uroleucon formosanum]